MRVYTQAQKDRRAKKARECRAAMTPEQRAQENARHAKSMRERLSASAELRDKNRRKAREWGAANRERVRITKKRYDQRRRDDPRVWAAHMVSSTKSRSQKKDIPFDLTAEYILSLIPADRLCPALGIPLIFGKKLSRNSPSIDRLAPALGYVIGNVAIISHKANSMKQDCTDSDELRKLADFMDCVAIARRSAAPPAEEYRRAA